MNIVASNKLINWDKVEAKQIARNLKSWGVVGEQDRLRVAAEECAHWNRMYRELLMEVVREDHLKKGKQNERHTISS